MLASVMSIASETEVVRLQNGASHHFIVKVWKCFLEFDCEVIDGTGFGEILPSL
jgi:hypothetical protein